MEGMRGLDGRAQMAPLEPVGVIDIGSNSVRLVVYEGAVRARRRCSTRRFSVGWGVRSRRQESLKQRLSSVPSRPCGGSERLSSCLASAG